MSTQMSPTTGIGTSSSTSGKNQWQEVPQVDPTQALAYFNQAGIDAAQGYAQGNTAYQAALQTAAQQIQTGFSQANAELQPLSEGAMQAFTLQQQMLGITPNNVSALPGQLTTLDPALGNIAQLINQAGSSNDPTQRAALQTQIDQGLTQAGSNGITAAQAAITALGSNPIEVFNGINPNDASVVGGVYTNGNAYLPAGTTAQQAAAEIANTQANYSSLPNSGNIDAAGNSSVVDAANNAAGQNATTFDAQQSLNENAYNQWNTTNTADQAALASANTLNGNLTTLENTFNNSFDPNAVAYSGDQVAAKVASTPGYQFQLDQGDQQILRNQAAIGNLGTGNTQAALVNYGQQYAQNAYQGYMNNLSNVVNEGIPATNQIAANDANQGGYLSNLSQISGNVANQAAIGEGQSSANAFNAMGNTYNQDAIINAQLEMQGQMAQEQQQSQALQSAMGLAGTAMNNASNQSNANSAGSGYFSGVSAGSYSPTYNYGSNSTPSVSSNGGSY